ncbi:MAG: hypothetical protein AAB323_00460 [Pseudomonadota bacterium]
MIASQVKSSLSCAKLCVLAIFLLPSFVFAKFSSEEVMNAARNNYGHEYNLYALWAKSRSIEATNERYPGITPLSPENQAHYRNDLAVEHEIKEALVPAVAWVKKETGLGARDTLGSDLSRIDELAMAKIARDYNVSFQDIYVILGSNFPAYKELPDTFSNVKPIEYIDKRASILWQNSAPKLGEPDDLTPEELAAIKEEREERKKRRGF